MWRLISILDIQELVGVKCGGINHEVFLFSYFPCTEEPLTSKGDLVANPFHFIDTNCIPLVVLNLMYSAVSLARKEN